MRALAIGNSLFGKSSLTALVFACALAAPMAASAAGSDELWEIKIDMPGMPSGMLPPQQSCQSKDPRQYKAGGKGAEDCKVTKVQESGNKRVISMTCPKGQMVSEFVYNAARTEYTGTLKMTEGGREQVMSLAGRKIGTCDAQLAQQEREDRQAKIKGEMESMQARMAADTKSSDEETAKKCGAAVDSMDIGGLGMYGRCHKKSSDKTCVQTVSALARTQPTAAKVCPAKVGEFCERYQTVAGFAKARGNEMAAEMCELSVVKVKASLCPQALKTEDLNFLIAYCPVESKQVGQQHCAGRDYSAIYEQPRYGKFCQSYLRNRDFDDNKAAASGSKTAPESDKSGDKASDKKSVKDEAINKLKGLFGK